MKGIRMTLDTKVNKNYVEDWRKVGWYDKASDSITGTSATDKWTKVSHLPFYWLSRIIKHCNILIDNLLTFRK